MAFDGFRGQSQEQPRAGRRITVRPARCRLTGARLTGAGLNAANLDGANLNKTNFTNAVMTGTTLVGADLTDVDEAYKTAAKAQIKWAAMLPRDRAQVFRRAEGDRPLGSASIRAFVRSVHGLSNPLPKPRTRPKTRASKINF